MPVRRFIPYPDRWLSSMYAMPGVGSDAPQFCVLLAKRAG